MSLPFQISETRYIHLEYHLVGFFCVIHQINLVELLLQQKFHSRRRRSREKNAHRQSRQEIDQQATTDSFAKKQLTAGASSDQGAEKIDSRRKNDKRTHSPWSIQSDP
jgi:hypothetical protein